MLGVPDAPTPEPPGSLLVVVQGGSLRCAVGEGWWLRAPWGSPPDLLSLPAEGPPGPATFAGPAGD